MDKLFQPVDWCLRSNMYEVNVRQYTPEGTFKAFSKHLPRLKDMGVEVLWFMPVTPISIKTRQGTLGSYYACSDYKSVNPEFGKLEDFKNLTKQAHDLGFKVIIDWVANHTGWDHIWTTTNPEFYKRNAAGEFYDTNNWHDVIDLNYYDHAMRREMIGAMEFWVRECNLDGFRCDMAHLVPLDFWRQARTHLDQIKPLLWLAETEDLNYQSAFDISYAWHWMHRSEAFSKGTVDVNGINETLHEYLVKSIRHMYLFFTANHDENSWNGTEYEKYGPAAAALAVLSCTFPGMPLIYSGQELPNKKRLKFFDKDEIQWTPNVQLQGFYKALLDLRKRNRALTSLVANCETFILHTNSPGQVIAFLRVESPVEVITILNISANAVKCVLHSEKVNGMYTNIFDRQQFLLKKDSTIELEAWGYKVLEK
jgi:glycosidase